MLPRRVLPHHPRHDGRQDHLYGGLVRVEPDARPGRRGLGTPGRGLAGGPRAGLLARRVDEGPGEPGTGQVGVTAGQPVQQVQAAVGQVEGLISALGEEPSRGNVQIRQAQPAARRGRPGQEALRVQAGIEPAAGKEQPEEPGEAGGGQDLIEIAVGFGRWRSCHRTGRQEHARLAGAGHVQVVPGPGAGHEQDAAFPLQVLGVRGGVLGFRGDRRGRGNQALLDADDRDGLELQALHRVHRARPDGLGVPPAAQRDRRDAVGLQRLARLAHQAGGPGRHADGMRLDAGGEPRANPFGKKFEFLGPCGGHPSLRARAVHRRPVAEQGVHLAVQAGHRVRPEQRHRPGQDLLGGPVVQRQPPAPPPHADPQAGQGDPVVVDALVRVGRDEQVVRARRHGRAEQPPLGRVQVLGLVHEDVPVARRSRLPEQPGGLVGQLQVSGLAGGGEFGGDLLRGPPDQAALGLAERPAPAGARAGQVRLLGAQVLGQDDLLPLVLAERRGEVEPGLRDGLGPAVAQHPLVRDDGRAAGLPDDAVGQPVHVEHLDLLAHVDVPDEQVELGGQGAGQVAVEGGEEDWRFGAFGVRGALGGRGALGQQGRAVQHGHRLAGAGAAGHLRRAGVTGLVGDVALARVQERAPRRERVREDVPQLLRPVLPGGLHVLVQLGVLAQEAFRDRQACHG